MPSQLPNPRTKYCPAASALSIAVSNDENPSVVVCPHDPQPQLLPEVVVFSLSVQTSVLLL